MCASDSLLALPSAYLEKRKFARFEEKDRNFPIQVTSHTSIPSMWARVFASSINLPLSAASFISLAEWYFILDLNLLKIILGIPFAIVSGVVEYKALTNPASNNEFYRKILYFLTESFRISFSSAAAGLWLFFSFQEWLEHRSTPVAQVRNEFMRIIPYGFGLGIWFCYLRASDAFHYEFIIPRLIQYELNNESISFDSDELNSCELFEAFKNKHENNKSVKIGKKIAAWIGLLFGACLLPIEYYYGSKAGGNSLLLQIFFGSSTAISFSALFARTAGESFSRLVTNWIVPENIETILATKFRIYHHNQSLLWFISLVASLPLTYLNDINGYGFLNVPVLLVQMATYFWSLDKAWSSLKSFIVGEHDPYKQASHLQTWVSRTFPSLETIATHPNAYYGHVEQSLWVCRTLWLL